MDHLNPVSKTFCRHDCPDNRTRYVCNIRGTNDWAVVVLQGTTLVTSFITNQEYAQKVLDDDCSDRGFYAHP